MNLLLLCSAVVIALLTAEVALRLFYPQKTRAGVDAYAGVPGSRYYGLRPNYRKYVDDRVNPWTFTTNSYGIRDVEFDPTEPHPQRVIFLGDSFTQGVSVDLDDTFVKQFERRMEQATGRDWQAVNLAVAGGSTLDEVYTYRTKGMALAHRYVVLGVYMNDMRDNLAFQDRPLYGGTPERVTAEKRARLFFASNSQLWNLLADRLDSPLLYRLRVRRDQSWFLPYLQVNETNDVRRAWALTFGALNELRDLVRSRNAELMLLLIPTKIQIDPALYARTIATHGLTADQLQFDKPQRRLKQFAVEAGIPVIDLLDSFGRRPNQVGVYYLRDDNHFNKNGYAVTGAVLAKAFLERCGDGCDSAQPTGQQRH